MKEFVLYLILTSGGGVEHQRMDVTYDSDRECRNAGRRYVVENYHVKGYICQGPKVEAEYHFNQEEEK